MFMHFSCICTLFSIYLLYLKCVGTFLIVSFFPLSILFTLVVFMAPKCKSTPARNPFRSGASSSFDSAPLAPRFHDDDVHKAFSENLSRHGIHSKCQVILADFTNTDLPTIIHSQGW